MVRKSTVLLFTSLLLVPGVVQAAGELHASDPPGETVYAIEWNPSSTQVLTAGGSTFGTFSAGSWASYAIPLPETATGSGQYAASESTSIPSGSYPVTIYKQVGGSPANTDIAIAGGELQWTGSAKVGPLDTYNQAVSNFNTLLVRIPQAVTFDGGGNLNVHVKVSDIAGGGGGVVYPVTPPNGVNTGNH